MKKVSVIIPTYNPNLNRFKQVLKGLQAQTLALDDWELVVVDNNSSESVSAQIDLSWHLQAKVVIEPRQGLTFARLKGFAETQGDVVVMVDDDNILDENYLKNALNIFNGMPEIGAAGGKSLPLFEAEPPDWLRDFYGSLALRDRGDEVEIAGWDNNYPASAPIGAGMCLNRKALQSYLEKANKGQQSATDRTGKGLSSGGDNEIVLEIIKSGWKIGYFPQLQLQHIIPQSRMSVGYLARLIRETNQSWVRLLATYDISPWGKISAVSAPLRKFKAYFTNKAWQGPVNYINWQAACGLFEGLTERKEN